MTLFSSSVEIQLRRRNAPKLYVILWKFAVEYLQSRYNDHPELPQYFSALININFKDFIENYTPHLIFQLNKLTQLIQLDKAIPAFDLNLFILYTADCFSGVISHPVRITLESDTCNIFLPKKGMVLQISENHLEMNISNSSQVSFNQPISKAMTLHASYVLTTSFDPFIMGGERFDKIDNELDLNYFGKQIKKAFDLIHLTCPTYVDRLLNGLKYIVPLKSSDPNNNISFTVDWFPGVIFCSSSDDELIMSETIVHEFGHNELHEVDACTSLFDITKQLLFYSPWRKEPRPIQGLYHGLYVFCEVHSFLELLKYVHTNRLKSIRLKQDSILIKLLIAVNQIVVDCLTESGQQIFTHISNYIHRQKFNLPFNQLDATVTEMRTWQRLYPDIDIKIPRFLSI